MKRDEKKREFDLSKLTLKELVNVFNEINDFIKFLNESKIEINKEGNENE